MANGDDRSFLQDLLDSIGNTLATAPVDLALGIRGAGRGAREAISDTSPQTADLLKSALQASGPAGAAVTAATDLPIQIFEALGFGPEEFGAPSEAQLGRSEQFAGLELEAAQIRQGEQQRVAEQEQAQADFNEQLRQQVESGDFNFVVRDDEIIPSEQQTPAQQAPRPGVSIGAPGTAERAARNLGGVQGQRASRAAALVDAGFTPDEARNLAEAIPPESGQEFLAVTEARRRQSEGLDLNTAIKAFLSSGNEALQGIGASLALSSLSPEDLASLDPRTRALIDSLVEAQ